MLHWLAGLGLLGPSSPKKKSPPNWPQLGKEAVKNPASWKVGLDRVYWIECYSERCTVLYSQSCRRVCLPSGNLEYLEEEGDYLSIFLARKTD